MSDIVNQMQMLEAFGLTEKNSVERTLTWTANAIADLGGQLHVSVGLLADALSVLETIDDEDDPGGLEQLREKIRVAIDAYWQGIK